MNIIHTVASIEEEASGPSYTVPSLIKSLAGLGHDVALLSLGRPYKNYSDSNGYKHIRFPNDFDFPIVNKLGISRKMKQELSDQKNHTDIFHTHGLWMMPNIYPAKFIGHPKPKLVMTTRGMLGKEALQFSKQKKKIFWALAQKQATEAAHCFHATSEQEYADIRSFGLKQPVAIIPNGIDLPEWQPKPKNPRRRRVISLGRIHPKKALDRLVFAWAKIEPDYPNWDLLLVGPSENGYAEKLARQAEELKLTNFSISKPVYGNEKINLLRNSDVFALSTLNENFAMTVAESLAVATPVISTKGAPWQGLEAHKCGWWIDHGVEPMVEALRAAMSLPEQKRNEMGERGQYWMAEDFSWESIANQMIEVYDWLLGYAEKPACVKK